MMCYSVQPSDKIFIKSYGFLPSAKYMSKYFCKNISKLLREARRYFNKFWIIQTQDKNNMKNPCCW